MAERWARQLEDQIDSGAWTDLATAERTKLEELLQRYEAEFTPRKRSSSERGRLRQLARELGDLTATECTPQVVVDYAHRRLAGGLATQTVVHELNSLSVVFRTAMALWGIALQANPVVTAREIMKPMGTLRVRNARDRRPRPGELGAIIAVLPGPIDVMACLAIETCLRRGELVRMKPAHVHGSMLEVPETKTDTPRTIPLSAAAVDLVGSMPASGWGVRPDSVTQAWGRACERAGVEDLTWHDLRHEGTSRLFEGSTFGRSLNIAEAALVTGHRDVRQLMRYTNLRPESIIG